MSMVYRLVLLPMFMSTWASILSFASPYWLYISSDAPDGSDGMPEKSIGLWQECSSLGKDQYNITQWNCTGISVTWNGQAWFGLVQGLECIALPLYVIGTLISTVLVFARRFFPHKKLAVGLTSKILCGVLYFSSFLLLLTTVIFPIYALKMQDQIQPVNEDETLDQTLKSKIHVTMNWCYWIHLLAFLLNIIGAVFANILALPSMQSKLMTSHEDGHNHMNNISGVEKDDREYGVTMTPAVSTTTMGSGVTNRTDSTHLEWGGSTDRTSETLV
ncbi:unnamed protein product [Owenia fusiformis]|uniref:Uncharacterized protein n=1 Tax=Owenia fusiformis TaxID=6347 RepID=A0A8J1TBX0_OWEFU|nr:unnamed protein product [Owenia fusiformis]